MGTKFYLVGGAVRDELLGLSCKDYDFAVEAGSYEEMRAEIANRGGEIFLEKPEFATIRAKMAFTGKPVCADFVLCRRDGYYSDGRRPDLVMPGTLFDDLSRRDFTVNAIAKSENGVYIDPFHGRAALSLGILDTVGEPVERFSEDSLRMLRAIRFVIIKDLEMSERVDAALHNAYLADKLNNISDERIREELLKCFRHNTPKTLDFLRKYDKIGAIIFSGKLWLKPTLEEK